MPSDNFSLILRTGPQFLSSKSSTCTAVETITDMVAGWNRNTIWNGGADVGQFEIYGDANQLATYWQTWLGMDILETDQGISTWNGQIQRVELYAGSVPMARDLTLMYNRVRGQYDMAILELEDQWTAWYDLDESQYMYGVREEEVTPSSGTRADCILQAQFINKMHGWPPRFPCSNVKRPDEVPHLKVYVSGYKHTLNNRYVPDTPTWVVNDEVSNVIDDIIDDSDYINVKKVASNDHQVATDIGLHEKSGDLLDSLLEFTDTSQNLYHGYVNNRRQFIYEVVDFEPDYYIANGEVYADSGITATVAPRHVRPGVFRVMDFPVSGADEGSIFKDRRDVLIEDIGVDAAGIPSYKPKSSIISDYVAMMESRKRYLMITGFMDLMGEQSGSMSGYTCTE